MRSRLPDRPYTDSPLGFNRHIFPEVIIMGFPLRILTSVSSAFKKALVRVVLINKEKKKKKDLAFRIKAELYTCSRKTKIWSLRNRIFEVYLDVVVKIMNLVTRKAFSVFYHDTGGIERDQLKNWDSNLRVKRYRRFKQTRLMSVGDFFFGITKTNALILWYIEMNWYLFQFSSKCNN